MKFENIEITNYPNFNEYKLVNIFPIEKVKFRRGNSYENLFAKDYSIWQDYFCDVYKPPCDKKIALFHCCSWAKPYDFSFIVKSIRTISDKYIDVHRIIVSNIGAIPYEFQMNPTFCAYDFPPTINMKGSSENEINKEQLKYFKIHYKRIYRYLQSHKEHYDYVVTLGIPIKYSMYTLISIICKELNLKHINVIDKSLYQKFKLKKYEDSGEIYTEGEILDQLDFILSSISRRK